MLERLKRVLKRRFPRKSNQVAMKHLYNHLRPRRPATVGGQAFGLLKLIYTQAPRVQDLPCARRERGRGGGEGHLEEARALPEEAVRDHRHWPEEREVSQHLCLQGPTWHGIPTCSHDSISHLPPLLKRPPALQCSPDLNPGPPGGSDLSCGCWR